MLASFNPYQEQLLDLCSFSAARKASDIHIEPMEEGLRVRIRSNGTLSEVLRFEKGAAGHFLESAKSLLQFDMSRIGVPQDTRFRHPKAPINYRGSLLPTLWGEKICLRIMTRGVSMNLETYSLAEDIKQRIKKIIQKKEGLILISGPTGSGKSSLMYSILGSIDYRRKCVYTVEDPVENEIDGLMQVPVDHKKVTFGSALRTLMRQDPDVIMIGEIRDEETAKIAVGAAGTGHLVIATVHANSANQVLGRMKNLGISEYDLKSVLLMSSVQRLIRINCDYCSDKDLVEETIENPSVEKSFLRKSKGCRHCDFTGTISRKIIFEGLFKKDSDLEQVGSMDGTLTELLNLGLISFEEYQSNKTM